MKKKCKINWKILIIALFVVYAIGFLGSLFNTSSNWYESPSITPPNFVFPIVWNILFFLIALSFYFAFVNLKKKSKNSKKQKKVLILIFGINLILNFLWGVLFFGLKNPTLAFVDLILLWISIGAIFIKTWKIKKLSSWLILPYWLWVSFAGILNWLIAF